MEEKCRNCEDRQACVPFFVHENSMMHYNRVNRRVLVTFSVLFLVMCITVSFIIGVLVNNNTIREKQIIDMMTQRITEVENGVHQFSNP